jgi:microsomal dipeptidase-like Zn-dependent dipeptidase
VKRRALRWIAYGVLAILLAGLGIFFFIVPERVDRALNRVAEAPPYAASPEARAVHARLDVADLHADTLLWGRDLLERTDRGHVDLPRLVEGNVALQVFSVVTKSPRNLNIERNDGDSDNILLLALGQRWPVRTWFSLMQRALYQADRLRAFAAAADGRLVLIRTRRDLRIFVDRRKLEHGIVAALLSLEGAHPLEGDPANVDLLFDAGFRMMGPSHYFDNEMSGSAHGVDKGGLTEKGREVIQRMEARRMIVDLAHGSEPMIADVLALATRPVVVSHTGVRGTCDNRRNLSDDQLRAIARNGGLIGIAFWQTAVCGTDAAAIARAIRYTADLIGVEHVALGSDFDGATRTPFDASGMVKLTEALLAVGLSREDVAKVMGGNELRFLMENLPE